MSCIARFAAHVLEHAGDVSAAQLQKRADTWKKPLFRVSAPLPLIPCQPSSLELEMPWCYSHPERFASQESIVARPYGTHRTSSLYCTSLPADLIVYVHANLMSRQMPTMRIVCTGLLALLLYVGREEEQAGNSGIVFLDNYVQYFAAGSSCPISSFPLPISVSSLSLYLLLFSHSLVLYLASFSLSPLATLSRKSHPLLFLVRRAP